MLSRTTTQAARTVAAARHHARRYATTVEAAGGIRISAADANSPTASVTMLVKAGTRYEQKPGAANALKHFAFKATNSRSSLATVRETELYGGILSTTLTREHLAVTAEFMKGDEAYFVDLLTSFATTSKFTRWEFEEYVMLAVQDEAVQAGAKPATVALETAHRLAFRTGLGNGLFAPSHAPVNVHDIKQYADSVLVPGNVAFLSTGLEADALARLVGDKFEEASLGKNIAAPTSNATKYYGGETRVPGTGAPTAFIGFGHTGGASPALAALAAHLQPSPAVKWGTGLSPLSSNLPSNAAAHAMYLPYSDAGLFGFLVQGGTEGAVGDAAKAAVNVLKQAASGLEKDAGIRAVAQAKFAAASAIDSRNGYTAVLGPKLLSGEAASAVDALKAFEGLDGNAVSKAAADLLKAKPLFITVGDVSSLPYADEVGL